MHLHPTWDRKSYWTLALFAFPFLWLIGVHLSDIARVIYCLAVFLWVGQPSFLRDKDQIILFSKHQKVMLLFLTCYGLLLFSTLILRVYQGDHGIDHGIFSQVATNFAHHGHFNASLNRWFTSSFLADHFSPGLAFPGLAFPGLLIRWGIPSHSAVILFQCFGFLVSLYLVYRICRQLEFDPGTSLFILICLALNGPIRSQVFWGTQLEYMAFPFAIACYERWLSRKHWQCLAYGLMAFIFKETLMLWGMGFSLFVLFDSYRKQGKWHREMLPYLVFLSAAGVCFGVFYFYHDQLFGRSFDYNGRVHLWGTLTKPKVLVEKALYLAHFFVPVVFLPFLDKKFLYYLIPVLPAFAMVLVTDFPEMYRINKHYGAFPSLLILLGSICIYSREAKARSFTLLTATTLLSGSLFFGSDKPIKALLKVFDEPTLLHDHQLTQIPIDSTVVVDDQSSLFLLDRKELLYFGTAKDFSDRGQPLEYDFMVLAKKDGPTPPHGLVLGKTECIKSEIWNIWCPAANGQKAQQ